MSWMSELAETYDNCISAVGDQSYKTTLMPLSHITAEAQITIILDIDGNFIDAEEVPKGSGTTIIPVTENSATRSSGAAPHPLCDKLIYVAGDYEAYVESKKDNISDYHKQYMELLESWKNSEFCTEKVEAVYNYLSKNKVFGDLIKANVLKCSENNMLDPKAKTGGVAQTDCFVRFKVLKPQDRHYISETWLDKELFDSYTAFNSSFVQNKSLCYVTGENSAISVKHPAKIRSTADKAKIISSNNEKSFVFQGRFLNAEEAATIGYETTQKAHNALRWLIGNQGYKNGSEAIVAWSVKGKKIPQVLEDADNPFGDMEDSEKTAADTGAIFAQKLNKAIAGYKQDLEPDDKIVVMSVDTADSSTNGRLSIKYYCELEGSVYFDNIKSWYGKCFWEMIGTKDKPARISVPIPREIAEAAYGIERNNFISTDDKIQKQCIDRILPCIINGRPFPGDLVKLAVENVSRHMSFSDYNHKKLIAITCAMIRAYYKDSKGECITMNLSETNDRSYLFGRLLAVADILEQRTFGEDEKNRATNAKRYWSAFVKKPAKTWGIISERLLPYMDKQSKYLGYYNRLLEEIHSKFDPLDFNDNELNSKYILGYWCQRKEMNTKKAEMNKEEN